jgi:hypothetical protein
MMMMMVIWASWDNIYERLCYYNSYHGMVIVA